MANTNDDTNARAETSRANYRNERASQFAGRIDIAIEEKLDQVLERLQNLDALRLKYRQSLNGGSWVHSGDFGRINDTLANVLETMEWMK